MHALSTCFHSAYSFFPNWVDPQEFGYVTVQKKDGSGNLKWFSGDDGTRVNWVQAVENLQTGDLYVGDPPALVAVKCTLIALAILPFTVIKTGYQIISAAFHTTGVVASGIIEIGTSLKEGRVCHLRPLLYQGIKLIRTGCWDAVRSPYYGIAILTQAVVFGIIDPYQARASIARLEHAWNRHISYKSTEVAYLAVCFQIRGNIKDPAYTPLSRRVI